MIKSLKIIVTSLSIIFAVSFISSNVVYKNISISEPLGYYLALPLLPINRDSLVLTCLTDRSYKHVFNELGMQDVKGQCDNGMSYLLKRVAAVKGDKVEITTSGVMINGLLVLNSKQFIEGRGIKLYPLPVGYSHVLADDEYFMLGQSTHSVDSRYFGIVKRNDIYRRAISIYEFEKQS